MLHERPSQKITLYQIVPVPPTLIRLCVLVVLALTQKACLLQGYSVMAAYIFLIAVRYPLPPASRPAVSEERGPLACPPSRSRRGRRLSFREQVGLALPEAVGTKWHAPETPGGPLQCAAGDFCAPTGW